MPVSRGERSGKTPKLTGNKKGTVSLGGFKTVPFFAILYFIYITGFLSIQGTNADNHGQTWTSVDILSRIF